MFPPGLTPGHSLERPAFLTPFADARRFILPAFAATLAIGLAVALAADYPAWSAPIAAPPTATGKVTLAPHLAIYDLKLAKSSGSRGIEAVRGRILYDFSGNACDGYELKFRQVSELDSAEGKPSLSDLRSTTWEDASAKKFRFNSENRMNDKAADVVDGSAERSASSVAVELNKPTSKKLNVPVDAVFPTEHMRRIVEAALAGKTILDFPVYDGSETGEKLYNTLTVIGAQNRFRASIRPTTPAARSRPSRICRAGRSPSAISRKKAAKPNKPANRRRSMPSPSSFMRTASRARLFSITTISKFQVS